MFRTLYLLFLSYSAFSQSYPHPQAHAHNDYEHSRPLFEALEHGFISVEADVHLVNGKLLVSHNRPGKNAPTLRNLYLRPLDSLLKINGSIYKEYTEPFYLMIDSKTEAERTYRAIQKAVSDFPDLLCRSAGCPVKIFISGNRATALMLREEYKGLALDGRPDDLGKGISAARMPVVSDHYGNWSKWEGKSAPRPEELERIRTLAQRVHAEGKKLRLWAIPDQALAWKTLLEVGVDLLNTDRLKEMDEFFEK